MFTLHNQSAKNIRNTLTVFIFDSNISRICVLRMVSIVGTIMSENLASDGNLNSGKLAIQFFQQTCQREIKDTLKQKFYSNFVKLIRFINTNNEDYKM